MAEDKSGVERYEESDAQAKDKEKLRRAAQVRETAKERKTLKPKNVNPHPKRYR